MTTAARLADTHGRDTRNSHVLAPETPLKPPDLNDLGLSHEDCYKAMIVAAYYASRLMPLPTTLPQTKMRWIPPLLERWGQPADAASIRYGWSELDPAVRDQVYQRLRAANPGLGLPEQAPKVHAKIYGDHGRGDLLRPTAPA